MVGKNLRVGIAGYGVVGRRRHACIRTSESMDLIAVCDRRSDVRHFLDDGIRLHESYEDLLTEDLDAIFICMSNDMAAEVTIAALNRGLHTFCEKPPARSMTELAQVIHAEKHQPETKLMYGFNHRYHEAVEDAIKLVEAGSLGNIISIRGLYGKSQLVTFDQPDWRTKRDIAGGGVLLDQGIHMVDLMRVFGGEFNEVHSMITNSHWGYDVEDNAFALLRGPSGIIASLTSSATQWRHRFSLEVTLSRGSLILGGILSSSKSYGSETLTVVHANPKKDSGDPRETMTKYNEDKSWTREVIAFRDTIIQGLPVSAGSSIDAARTLALVYQIYYQDEQWRSMYEIDDPDPILKSIVPDFPSGSNTGMINAAPSQPEDSLGEGVRHRWAGPDV